jgi:outer membrane protein insertion porin family
MQEKRVQLKQVFAMMVAAILLLAVGTDTPAQQEEARNIVEIQITGNKNIGRDAILSAIELTPGMPFDRQKMQEARNAIDRMGFFQVVSAREEAAPGGVRVVFEVVENPVVTAIVFRGNTVVSEQELLDAMRTKVGQVYNINTLEQDLRDIENLYARKQYLAYVTNEAEIDPATGVLTLPIMEFRVGRIEFTGLKKTKPWVLKREMKLKEGDLYNAQQLQRDITRIYELDYLDAEKYEPPRREPGDREGYLNIIIPVQEKKTGQVSVGLGYSSYQKVVGRVELSETNFQGKGLGLNALYEAGGSRGDSYELGYYSPWFRPDNTSLSIRLYDRAVYRFSSSAFGGGVNIGEDADYTERRKGVNVGLSRPFGEKLRGFVTFRTESVDANFREGSTVDPSLVAITQSGSVTGIAFKGVLDRRDFALDPGVGSYYSLSFEPGYSDVSRAGKGGFTKTELDLRRYFSPEGPKETVKDRRRTIAVRLRAATSTGKLPFWEQYFVGGAERLRGYREDRFWGNSMLLASVEYRVPLSGGLGGVIFADYGDAWGNDYVDVIPELSQSSSFKGHFGYGLGIRVATPIGNLRFDYGFGDEGSRTHFSIGQAF